MLYWRQSFTVSAFALPCSAPISTYHILSWFIHGSFMFKDTEGQHEPIKAIAWIGLVPVFRWRLRNLSLAMGWPWARSGLLLGDTAPKATSVAMACKPSPGDFITSSTQKVDIYWRMALSHCLKLNMGLLKIIEHQWCDFTNPMICYTVEYTLVTLVLEFGSLAPMFEPFSKGYPCTRFFQGMKEQMRLVSQMLRDINMVEGARFTLHQTRLNKIDTPNLTYGYLWLQCNRGSFSNGDKFPTPCLGCMQCLSNIVTMTMLKKWRKHEETIWPPNIRRADTRQQNAAIWSPILTPDISRHQRDVLPGCNLHVKSKAADLRIRRSNEECIL